MKLIRTTFLEVHDAPDHSFCKTCKTSNPRVWEATRYALDSTEERQGLLKIRIGVYRCSHCNRYYRFNPEYIRPRHLYTNKIVNVAVASAIEDKMPICRIRRRLARDFGVEPAESAIREWIRKAGDEVVIEHVLPKAKEEFSGVLCVDEVYSGRLAVLVATDPNRGDALVAYDLSDKDISQAHVRAFFKSLKNQGIDPSLVVTDGSGLYPSVIREIWPNISHQLCLFHLSQKVCDLAKKAVRKVARQLPKRPAPNRAKAKEADAITALAMFRKGVSKRQIAKELGISRNSLRKWIAQPDFVERKYGVTESDISAFIENEVPCKRRKQGIAKSLPMGWESWDQAEKARKSLIKLAYRVAVRLDRLPEKTKELYASLKNTPLEASILSIRRFVTDWHGIWWKPGTTEIENRQTAIVRWNKMAKAKLPESCEVFNSFRRRMTPELFANLSAHFDGLPATNNSAERFARRIKNIQKARYRLRTKESLDTFIKLDEVLKRGQIHHNELGESSVFRERGV